MARDLNVTPAGYTYGDRQLHRVFADTLGAAVQEAVSAIMHLTNCSPHPDDCDARLFHCAKGPGPVIKICEMRPVDPRPGGVDRDQPLPGCQGKAAA